VNEEDTEDLPPGVEVLLERASKQGFMQLLGLLERITRNAPRIGDDGPPELEAIRIRHDPALAFMPGEIVKAQAIESTQNGTKHTLFEIMTSFLGLTGSVSPIPSYITEEALEDTEQGQARRDFLDVFHHRLLSLFYRGARKYDFAGDYTSAASDIWSARVLSLGGVTGASTSLPRDLLLRLSPLFCSGGKSSAATLQRALADALFDAIAGAPLEVRQFVPTWVDIGEDDRTRLGRSQSTLAKNIVLGRRICDRSSKVDIVIGPITYEQHLGFLSQGASHLLAQQVISAFGQDHFEYELVLLVINDIPELRLSSKSKQGLGLVTWLHGVGRRDTTLEVKVPLREDREVEHAR
jgi:type VI secretion system protein ImpH